VIPFGVSPASSFPTERYIPPPLPHLDFPPFFDIGQKHEMKEEPVMERERKKKREERERVLHPQQIVFKSRRG
jgi:hypothetical protein